MKFKVISISIGAVLLIALFTIFYSRSAFTVQITSLYERDYSERIRNIEWDYNSVDVVSGATEAAREAQEDILNTLHDRYVDVQDITSYPLIFNGDEESILYIEKSTIPQDFIRSEHAEQIKEKKNGTFSFSYRGKGYYAVFSYYEPWDWYTAYIIPDSKRLAGVNQFTFRISITLAGAAGVLLILLFYLMGRAINPLHRLSEAIETMRQGDLSQRFEQQGKDEIAVIAQSFNQLGESFGAIVSRIKSSTDEARTIERDLQMKGENTLEVLEKISNETGSSSEDIKALDEKIGAFSEHVDRIGDAMKQLGEQVDQEVEAVERTSSTINQSNSTLSTMADLTREKREFVRTLQETAQHGDEQQQQSDRSIQEILSRVGNVSETVTIIQDIADRTNLLAMNAAIEAAHAGESGKGFAVVAEEIRNLAAQSTENATSIETSVKDIVERIHSASSLSTTTTESFHNIQNRIEEVGTAFEEVLRYTESLSEGSGEIGEALESLRSLSGKLKEQSNESTRRADEASQLIEEVHGISSRMRETVEHIDGTSKKSAEWMRELFDLTTRLRESMNRLSTAVSSFSGTGSGNALTNGSSSKEQVKDDEQLKDDEQGDDPAEAEPAEFAELEEVEGNETDTHRDRHNRG